MFKENKKVDKPIFELVNFCDDVFRFLEKNKNLLRVENQDIDIWMIRTKSDFENTKSLFSSLYSDKKINKDEDDVLMGDIFNDLSRVYKDCNDKLFLAKKIISNKLDNLKIK